VFTQPVTEMSTGGVKKIMFLGSKVRPVRGADNLTAIYAPMVYTMWDLPRPVTAIALLFFFFLLLARKSSGTRIRYVTSAPFHTISN
jgi:hypothetical protein